mmetsp:Transcript_31162/g.73997  ORF Transcript_31162/g.73997 Transcript_31162/m.73997 type:complete len:315 (-) Transcript_31162:561-1505(-)
MPLLLLLVEREREPRARHREGVQPLNRAEGALERLHVLGSVQAPSSAHRVCRARLLVDAAEGARAARVLPAHLPLHDIGSAAALLLQKLLEVVQLPALPAYYPCLDPAALPRLDEVREGREGREVPRDGGEGRHEARDRPQVRLVLRLVLAHLARGARRLGEALRHLLCQLGHARRHVLAPARPEVHPAAAMLGAALHHASPPPAALHHARAAAAPAHPGQLHHPIHHRGLAAVLAVRTSRAALAWHLVPPSARLAPAFAPAGLLLDGVARVHDYPRQARDLVLDRGLPLLRVLHLLVKHDLLHLFLHQRRLEE